MSAIKWFFFQKNNPYIEYRISFLYPSIGSSAWTVEPSDALKMIFSLLISDNGQPPRLTFTPSAALYVHFLFIVSHSYIRTWKLARSGSCHLNSSYRISVVPYFATTAVSLRSSSSCNRKTDSAAASSRMYCVSIYSRRRICKKYLTLRRARTVTTYYYCYL